MTGSRRRAQPTPTSHCSSRSRTCAGKPSMLRGSAPSWRLSPSAGASRGADPLSTGPPSKTTLGKPRPRWKEVSRALPLLLNQWANVLRWDLRPRLFLRTTEFLWQEGHTAHSTETEAREYAHRILH